MFQQLLTCHGQREGHRLLLGSSDGYIMCEHHCCCSPPVVSWLLGLRTILTICLHMPGNGSLVYIHRVPLYNVMWCFAVLLMGLGRVFTPVRTCSQSGRIAGSFTNFSGSSSQRGQDLTAVCRSQSGVTKHQKMFSYRLFLYRHGSLEAIRTVRNKDDLSLKGNHQKNK